MPLNRPMPPMAVRFAVPTVTTFPVPVGGDVAVGEDVQGVGFVEHDCRQSPYYQR